MESADRPYFSDGRPMYLDRQGQPIESRADAYEKLGSVDYKRVAEDTVGPYWISTVWLGIDHNFSRHGPPLIFETMVFHQLDDDTGVGFDVDGPTRYATEAEALAGHAAMVTLVRATTQEAAPNDEHDRR